LWLSNNRPDNSASKKIAFWEAWFFRILQVEFPAFYAFSFSLSEW
jgi:hypothetical protein